jgi:RecJ-like exonuclease
MKIKFTHENDDREEVVAELPAKFVVCPCCDGHGTHLNEAMREHAYSREEFEEEFDEEMQGEYFRRGGRYDVQCEQCGGKRVVEGVDEEACSTPELKALLKIYEDQLQREAEYRREEAYERRMGM